MTNQWDDRHTREMCVDQDYLDERDRREAAEEASDVMMALVVVAAAVMAAFAIPIVLIIRALWGAQ